MKILVNQPFMLEIFSENKLTILDGGARGEVFPPFNKVSPDILKVVRFEPDPGAQMIESDEQIIVPKGLWSSSRRVNLNIAMCPSASSVLDFNTNLQNYIDPLKEVRRTRERIEIECISIDEFMVQNTIQSLDFIKLDIHGAEYEVLIGAKETLKKTLGLLIESWTIPIHKSQKMRGAVENEINNNYFYLFEEFVHSRWSRRDKRSIKKQPVSIDSLYLKDPLIDDVKLSEVEVVKLIGISDLFGHTGYALQLAEFFEKANCLSKPLEEKIKSVLMQNFKQSLVKRIKSRILENTLRLLNDCAFK